MKKIQISYFKSVSIIAIINILLALLALMKDILLASYLGTSSSSDAFSLAFFIPDMIGNNLIAAAISTSCIPGFSKLFHSKDKDAFNLTLIFTNAVVTLAVLFGTGLLIIFRMNLIDVLGHGFGLQTKNLCSNLFIILAPTIILYPMVSIGLSVLQVYRRFLIASSIPVIFNLVFFLSTAACWIMDIPVGKGVYILSASVLAAEVLVFVITYGFIIKQKISLNLGKLYKEFRINFKESMKAANAIIKLSYGYFLILLLSQLVLYYEKYLCSNFSTGSLSALNYAYRISQFPIWVFVAAISMVAFPKMSEPGSEAKEVLKKALTIIVILNLPVMLAFSILNKPITIILFQRNHFDISSVKTTAGILAGYSLAILGQSICSIILKYMLSIKRIKIVIKIYLLYFILNVSLDFVLVKFFGVQGIGYGAAAAWSVCSVLMVLSADLEIVQLFRKNHLSLLKLCLSNIFIIIICLMYKQLWLQKICYLGFFKQVLYSFIVAAICLLLYIYSLNKLKVEMKLWEKV